MIITLYLLSGRQIFIYKNMVQCSCVARGFVARGSVAFRNPMIRRPRIRRRMIRRLG
jgi:hypothetical protein